jgi:glycosyltransferase involved in cell wall biosynthesis
MKKINVLMVGPDRGVHGGISAVVNELYAAGLDSKVNLKYIGTMKEGSKLKKLFVAAFAYVRFLKEIGRCDVVHIHFSSDSSFLRKSVFIKTAHRLGKHILLHQHGGDFKTFYGKQLDEKGKRNVRRTLAMGDRMLVLTKGWKDFFSKLLDEEKIEVFPNGVLTGKPSGQSESNEGSVFFGKKEYNKILFLGRICKDKGIDELLEALSSIHKYRPDVHLYIGGIYEDSSYKSKVDACRDYVTYLGWIRGEEKEKYLRKSGILVLPSYYEGFPVSIIEAMLRENVVIASEVGGIPDIIDQDKNGILIPAKDAKALENAIYRVLEDNRFAQELGENGRKTVLEKYSVERNVDRLVDLYREFVS